MKRNSVRSWYSIYYNLFGVKVKLVKMYGRLWKQKNMDRYTDYQTPHNATGQLSKSVLKSNKP